MAKTNLGKVVITPKGEYDPSKTYCWLDVVRYNGSSYLARKTISGITPTDGENYILLVAKGDKGEKGDSFEIYKTYQTTYDMNYDFYNVPEGKFVLISSNVEDEDNAKLYVRAENSFNYVTDLSGATGIKGEKGDKGDKGDRGATGGTAEVVQTTGDSEIAVMSQKEVTRNFDYLSSGLFPSGILYRGSMDVMASTSIVLMSSTDDTYLLTAGNYVYLTVKTNSFLKKRVYLEFKDGEKNVLSQRGIDTRSSAFCVALKVPSGAVVMYAGINNLSSEEISVEWFVSRSRPKNELYKRRIVAIGDSITAGANNENSSYIDIVAKNNDCQLVNYAISGATLVQTGTRACIGTMIDTAIADGNTDVDFLVISGGYNDSQNSINNPVGTFDNTNYAGQYDTSTICGALETIFYKAKNRFGIVHATRGVYYPKVIFVLDYLYPSQTPWTENRETIKKLCEKWGISCYDMSELSGLINHPDLSFKNTIFTDNVHPNEEGYQMIAKWLEKKLG